MDHRTLKTESLLAVIGALLCCALSRALAAEAEEERWNAYGQATYISQWKDAFPAAYTNLNGTPHSLLPQRERSWSATAGVPRPQALAGRGNLLRARDDCPG